MASFFKKLSKATPALTQGLTQGLALHGQMEDRNLRRDLTKRQLSLQEKQLAENIRRGEKKSSQEEIDFLTKQFESGLMPDPVGGGMEVRHEALNPNSDWSKLMEQRARFKAMSAGGAKAGQTPLTPEQLDFVSRGDWKGLAEKFPDVQVPSGYSGFLPAQKSQVGVNAGTLRQMGHKIPPTVPDDYVFPTGALPHITPQAPLPQSILSDIAGQQAQGGVNPEDINAALQTPAGRAALQVRAQQQGRSDQADRHKADKLQQFINTQQSQISGDLLLRSSIDATNAAVGVKDLIAQNAPGAKGPIITMLARAIEGSSRLSDQDVQRMSGVNTLIENMRNMLEKVGGNDQLTPENQRALMNIAEQLEIRSRALAEQRAATHSGRARSTARALGLSAEGELNDILGLTNIVPPPSQVPKMNTAQSSQRGILGTAAEGIGGFFRSLRPQAPNPSKARAEAAKRPAGPTREDRERSAKRFSTATKKIDIDEIDKYPRPGDVRKGFRYKGGDPSKKENWEKVE